MNLYLVVFSIYAFITIVVCGALFVASVLLFKKNRKIVYLIGAGHIVADILILLTYIVYVIPINTANAYIFEGGEFGTFGVVNAFIGLSSWYYICCSLIFMGFTRFLVICWKGFDLGSKLTCFILVILVFSACALSYFSQYGFECCMMVYDKDILSHKYVLIDGLGNPSMLIIQLPINVVTTVCCIVFYGCIFMKIKYGKSLARSAKTTTEVRFAIQFFLLACCHLLQYITLTISPMISYGKAGHFILKLPGLFGTLNCLMNCLVMIIFNKEIQQLFKLRSKKLKTQCSRFPNASAVSSTNF